MKTILLVDDDKQLRSMFGIALRRFGYRVVEAESGVEGLTLARQHLPDLILSDIHMPGGDGTSLLSEVRRDPELRTKQVVLMTGRPDLVTPRRGMEEGADDFLVKPVGLEALRACMEARFSRASISWRVEDERLEQLRSSTPAQLPHEFFTPLAGIIGLMEILRTDFPTFTPQEVSDIHRDVYQSALRLNRTLRNYLLILEPTTVSSDMKAPALSAAAVEQQIRAGINEALRQNPRGDDLKLNLESCSLQIKPGDLSLIVEELVDNAFKFSRAGTPVFVKLSGDRVLTVTDRGRGLSAEEIRNIGAFKQFDRKKHEQQGLGLGLILVHRLISGYGAEFSIISRPGEETEARIVFPAAV